MAEFDIKELDRAFASEKQGARAAVAAPADKEAASSAKAVMAAEASVAGVAGFCEAWAKIRPFLNMAVTAFGMVFPNQAALAKTVIRVIDKQIIPTVCGTAE